jgi:UDP-N-acetylmuramoylalanine-D-glutamate ligase
MSINFNKKKILVVGLGDTGQSVLHFLANKECDIQAIDTRIAIDNFNSISFMMPSLNFSPIENLTMASLMILN